jgi:exopolysaccharide biosynthesis WecB/TagA/CpsF family protein
VERCSEFVGVRFHVRTLDAAADEIMARAGSCKFQYVITPNVQHVVHLHQYERTLEPVFRSAWRILCDSRVLSLLGRLRRRRIPVVPGSDLTLRLMERANAQGWKVAIVGSDEWECAKLQRMYPNLRIDRHTPPMGFISSEPEVEKCVAFVVRTRAALVFLALGMPRQELLAARIRAHPDARGIGLCIGGSIDFITGKQRRAPVWMQKLALEWLFRLASDPVRLSRRYLIECPRIFYLALRRAER